MKLKYNRDIELEVVGLGIFQPDIVITISDELGTRKYLDSGYFDEIKERKVKVKKLKRKELISNATRIKRTHRN